jgi:hypothetical protein
MKRFITLVGFAIALVTGADAAQACRVRMPQPPVISFPYQALAIGSAIRVDQASNSVEIRIDGVIDGRLRARRLRLPVEPDLVISCITAYQLHAGDRLFLVIRQAEVHPTSVPPWLPLEVAREREPLIADYLAAGSRSERRRVVARWREQHRAELAPHQ